MTTFTSKLPHSGTSIFAVMSKMAADHHAINLSQGFPDFPVSPKLISLVNENMKAGHNQYAPMPGVPQLREVIAEVVQKTYNHKADANTEITITSGATEALYATINALVHPGDEVIVFDPAYDSYDPTITLAGGRPVHLSLSPADYSINWKEVEEAINEKTKLIIINTPHNPSGSVLSASDLQTLEQIVSKNDQLFVVSDEVYERIIFDDTRHESVLNYPSLAKKSVAIFSFGKTFHATGWKVGYAVAPDYLTKEIRKVHQYLTFTVSTPVQMALATFMQDESNYVGLGKFYQEKRDYFARAVSSSRFEVLSCKGTYFQLLSYKNIDDRPELEMAEYLTKKYGVASIPTSAFYQQKTNNQVLRFCFAKSEETIDKAAEILCKI